MKAPACPVCGSEVSEPFCQAFDRVRNRIDPLWDVVRCLGCGCGWTAPPLPETEIASHYPETYLGDTEQIIRQFQAGELRGTRSWRKETEKVELVEKWRKGGRILDVGCAEGKFLWALDSDRWRRTGVEFSRQTVALVCRHFPDIEMIHGDIYSDRLQAGSFDIITFWHVLEHLPRPHDVMSRTAELLAPGGRVIVSYPNLDSFQARWFRHYWYAFDDVPRHLYHFSPQALERVLQEAGLQLEQHVFFSHMVNFHCWKYTLINWSEESFKSRLPYYMAKPFLFLLPPVEAFSARPGVLTTIGCKPLQRQFDGG